MTDNEYTIRKNFQDHDIDKIYCVLGVLDTPRGHEIEKYIIDNISSKYDVISVIHDGKNFEYTAINYALNFSLENDSPVLYLHTKGAANINPTQGKVINFWIDEFINHFNFYKNAVNSIDPIVAIPFTGSQTRNTWFNGYMFNQHTAKFYVNVVSIANRYYYECMYRYNKNIKIVPRHSEDINDNNVNQMLTYIEKHYKKIDFKNTDTHLNPHVCEFIKKRQDILDFNIKNRDKMWRGYKLYPITIQDKLKWLNINEIPWSNKYDIPLKSVCADKILVKEYAKNKIGEDIFIPILKIYNNTSEINWDELPNKFVIKCNHGSGMNLICKDKFTFNINEAVKKLNYWMNDDFTFRNGFESHYHWIKRKIFVEKYICDDPIDYKFWCMNGNPELYTINNGFGHGDIMYYNMDGSENNLYGCKIHDNYIKPKSFDLMVKYSKILAEDFNFVRVDFYEIDGKPYLGEMTFTPGAFGFRYKNPDDEIKIGNLLKI